MVANVTKLTSASATVQYFERDGYYAQHDPEHKAASRWHGEAARDLGLGRRTQVDPGMFHSILSGHVPKADIRLGRIRDGKRDHLPGIDITFSAPKSVSLEALVYGHPTRRTRVMRAHDRAVRATLDFIEAEILETRVHDPATGRRERVRAHGMVAGTFRHMTSRDLDPQLHTHAVVANMTRDAAGRWRSLDPGVLTREEKMIGAYYRNELARRLMAAGCVLSPAMAGPVPSFEIAGYDRSILDWFSNRRRAILRFMRERGWTYSTAAAQAATLLTRARKAEPDRAKLVGLWNRRADGLGREPENVRARAPDGGTRELSTLEIVWRAAEHLEERQSVFTESALRTHALGHAPGRHTLREIDDAVNSLRRDGHLVDAINRGGGRRFVTDRALRAEKEIIARMKLGLGVGAPLVMAEHLEEHLRETNLTPGQEDAVRTLLLGDDRIVGVQGYAGTGKTAMLRQVAALGRGRRVIGLAPTAVAAEAMSREAGIPARTLQSFLTRFRDLADNVMEPLALAASRERFAGSIVILDEASMVGAAQMRDLIRIAERLEIERLALVGDSRQLRAVSAGQPFRQLQEAGMGTALMDRIVRQRDPAMREAVEAVLARDPGHAIELLDDNVHEVEMEELGRTAAEIWLELDPGSRAGTAVLAPTHELRARINDAIREGLADEGVLHGREIVIERLISRGMTAAQKGDVRHYLEGDEVVFHHDLYGGKARAGDAFSITATEGERVSLLHADGRTLVIKPLAKKVRYQLDVFRSAPVRLRAGDMIRWTRNDNGRRLLNGERAAILDIGVRKMRLRTGDGRVLNLSRDDPQLRHLDHAWSSTVHGAQGLTVDNVIAVLDSGHESLADQSTFYVEISRARDSAVLLTDSRERLVEELEARSGEAMTALEATGGNAFENATPDEVLDFLAGEEPLAIEAARGPAEEAVRARAPARAPSKSAPLTPMRDWRVLAERAREEGTLPFYMDAYAAIVERVEALARRETLPDDLRREVDGILGEHAVHAGRQREIDDHRAALAGSRAEREQLEERARTARRPAGEMQGYGAWRGNAVVLIETGRRLLDAPRYRAHLDLIPGAGDQVRRDRERLEAEMEADDLVSVFTGKWRRVNENATAAGIHRYRAAGYDEAIGRAQELAGHEGVAPWAREGLAKILAKHNAGLSSRAAVDDFLEEAKACESERRRLEETARERDIPVADMEGYEAWHATALRLAAEGRRIMSGETALGTHLDKVLDARDDAAAGLAAMTGLVEVGDYDQFRKAERDNAERARNKGLAPFDMEDCPTLAAWAGRLAENPDLPDHAREGAAAFVGDREAWSRDRGTVEAFLAGAREAGARRDVIEGISDPAAMVEEHGRWLERNKGFLTRARDILAARARFAPHLETLGSSPEYVARMIERLGGGVREEERQRETGEPRISRGRGGLSM